MIEHKILESYSEGSPISFIADSFRLSEQITLDIIRNYRDKNRYKRTFTEDFKRMIAERDLNGVARSTIASELEVNINTVKKACEKYGQAVKDKATSGQLYTKIEGNFSLDICPNCGSKHNNLVDENTTYCFDCESEFEYYDGYIKKVNYEFLEE